MFFSRISKYGAAYLVHTANCQTHSDDKQISNRIDTNDDDDLQFADMRAKRFNLNAIQRPPSIAQSKEKFIQDLRVSIYKLFTLDWVLRMRICRRWIKTLNQKLIRNVLQNLADERRKKTNYFWVDWIRLMRSSMMIFNVLKLRHFYANRKIATDLNEIGVFRWLLIRWLCMAAAFSYLLFIRKGSNKMFTLIAHLYALLYGCVCVCAQVTLLLKLNNEASNSRQTFRPPDRENAGRFIVKFVESVIFIHSHSCIQLYRTLITWLCGLAKQHCEIEINNATLERGTGETRTHHTQSN